MTVGVARGESQVLCRDQSAFTQDRRPFKDIPQIAHVPETAVDEQPLARLDRDAARWPPDGVSDLVETRSSLQ
jgi:hypothetical protein